MIRFSARERYVVVAFLLTACVLFYWKLALSSEYVWFDHPDMCYIEIPRLNFQAREIHQGRFPLWDPGIWMGQPLLGQTQPGPVFPLNLVFFLLPLRDGYIDFRLLNWYFVVVHAIAAVGAYALCRDLRRSQAASIAAAFAFAFGGFVGTVAWLDVFNGAIWTPVICLFFLRAARGIRPWRNAALCGLVLGLTWLSGHHEVPLLVSYSLLGAWLFAAWRRRSAVGPALLTFAVAGLVAAVQLLPTAEFARRSQRWVGLEKSVGWNDAISYTVAAGYSLQPRSLPSLAIDNAMSQADSSVFLGLVVIAFAAVAIAALWRHPMVRWLAVFTAVATVFAMGNATPLHGLLYSYAPMLGKARIPVRAIHLLNFGLVVLAAYGFDAVLSRRVPSRLVAVVAGVGVLILAAFLFRPELGDGYVTAATSAFLLAVLTSAFRRRRISPRAFAVSVICLMLIELYPVSTRTFRSSFEKEGQKFVRTLTDNRDIADFLRGEPAPRRVAVNDTDIPANFADWHGFDGLEGYVAGVSENLLDMPRHTRTMQNLYGVTHYVGREPYHSDLPLAFAGATGVKVFRNPQALPRAWAVHSVERIASRSEVDPRLAGGLDPRRTALMTGDPPNLESCGGDEVRIAARAPNRIRMQARMNCRGMVIVSETWYPGWTARVDGRESTVLEVFGSLRGIVVDAGQHEVDLIYRPPSVYVGAALSAVGILLVASIVAVDAFRQRRLRPILKRTDLNAVHH